MNKFTVYIIYSEKSDLYYIGHTNNFKERIFRHNQNRNKYTKNKGPWELVVSADCEIYEVGIIIYNDYKFQKSFIVIIKLNTNW